MRLAVARQQWWSAFFVNRTVSQQGRRNGGERAIARGHFPSPRPSWGCLPLDAAYCQIGAPMPAQDEPPGVYIEEIPSGPITIAGVATSITAFVGRTPMGPGEPLSCQSFDRRNGASESQPLALSG
jgi:hypothetical protein